MRILNVRFVVILDTIARDCPNRNDKRRIMEYKRMNDEYISFMDDLGAGKVLSESWRWE